MTLLSKRKTKLIFETDNVVRGRTLVVEPERLVCNIRLKGTRKRYTINWETVLIYAAQIEANRIREERKARRKVGRMKK
jgi:hypothetical protein